MGGLAIWLPDKSAPVLPARHAAPDVAPASLLVTASGDWNFAFAVSQKPDAVPSSPRSSDLSGTDWWAFFVPLEMTSRDSWC